MAGSKFFSPELESVRTNHPEDYDTYNLLSRIINQLGAFQDSINTLIASVNTINASLLVTVIKSIQKGTITFDSSATLSGTATITSVNTAKAFVVLEGFRTTNVGAGTIYPTVELTNATTITATVRSFGTDTGYVVAFTVVEYA